MLRPDPAQRHRFVEIRDNAQLDAEQIRQCQVIDLGMPSFSQLAKRTSIATGPSS